MVMAVAFCVWEFGVKDRRLYIVMAAFVLAGIFVVAAPQHYYARLESILLGNQVKNSGDDNSAEARKDLLRKSLMVTVKNPIFGVGAGNFEVLPENGTWHVAHNSYTQISADCGIPALLLFLLFLRCGFRNIREIRKSEAYGRDANVRLFTGALYASLLAYIVGAFFADTAYSLYPYGMVAFTTALHRMTCAQTGALTADNTNETNRALGREARFARLTANLESDAGVERVRS